MLKLSDEIASYVNELFPNETTDNKIKRLVENEFMRRLAQYQHTIQIMEKKYDLDFITFRAKNIVAKKGYSFEVENDFCDWEMALDGVKTIARKLKELRGQQNDH